jgi:hypothetical protein
MKERKAKGTDRFVGIPFWVMNHASFRAASHRARSLLLDVLLQYNGRNNGSLVVCDKALKPLGWNSNDGITKAKRELMELGLLVETRRGAKPNRASWYALGWRQLDVKEGLDIDPRKYVNLASRKVESRPPQDGVVSHKIAPWHGVEEETATPPGGAMKSEISRSSTPPHGAYIDIAIPTGLEVEGSHV